jgi:hypothetical protein
MEKGQVVVELDEEDNIIVKASVICENAIQYEIDLTSKYERPHLEFDSETDPVERVYDANATLIINDQTADYGLISLQIIDELVGDITALYFVMSESSEDGLIPVGTYPIESSWWDYTVLASSGMDWDGSVMPSYYAGYADGWLVEPFYFFVSGEVVVTKNDAGELGIEINALNSCDIPVHIVYGPSENSGVENIQTITNANKLISNGQLLIIRDGKTYNVLGTQMK